MKPAVKESEAVSSEDSCTGPAVDSIVPVEFSVVYHDAEAEMKGPAFSQAERHARFRTAVKPGRLSVRDGAARVVGEMANGSSS